MQAHVHERRPAHLEPSLVHAENEPAECHARFALFGASPFLALQPRHHEPPFHDGELSAASSALDLADPELARDELRVFTRNAGHLLMPQLDVAHEART
jgi:hypothetical protein